MTLEEKLALWKSGNEKWGKHEPLTDWEVEVLGDCMVEDMLLNLGMVDDWKE